MTYHSFFLKALMLSVVMALPGLTLADSVKPKTGWMVNEHGMALYTYAKDTRNKSNCNDQCAKNWPPMKAESTNKSAGDWTVITRDDNQMQWAYKGKPLYTYVKDKKPEDTKGHGAGKGAWKVAKQ